MFFPHRTSQFAVFAGLLVAGVAAWMAFSVFPPHPSSLDDLFFAAGVRVLAISLMGAAFVRGGLAILRCKNLSLAQEAALRTAGSAAWFPVFIIFPSNTDWEIGISMVLTASIVMIFLFLRTAYVQSAVSAVPLRLSTFGGLGPAQLPALPRQLHPALCFSFCSQLGLLARLMGHWETASVLFSFGLGVLLWTFPAIEKEPEQRKPTVLGNPLSRAVLMVVLAVILSSIGLLLHLILGSSQAQRNSLAVLMDRSSFTARIVARFLAERFFPEAKVNGTQAQKQPHPLAAGAFGGDGAYIGVFLSPLPKPEPVWLAPVSPVPSEGLVKTAAKSLTIPFSGIYWFFESPFSEPPASSLKMQGKPETTGLRTSDHQPLQMEAHQKFSSPVSLNCCSQIQVVISNADTDTGSIFLEMILVDNRSKGWPPQSLGS